MMKTVVGLFLGVVMFAACVPDNKFASSSGTSGAPTPIPSVYGIASCAQLQAYPTLSECNLGTNAICTPSTQIVAGTTSTCFNPVAGWQTCTSTSATWSYGSWNPWCFVSNGVFQRTRPATCVRSNPVCECTAASQAVETCTNNGTGGFTACSGLPSNILTCGGGPTPTPTPAPTPVCNTGILDYYVNGNNSTSVLNEVKNSTLVFVSNVLNAKGYYWNKVRANNASVATPSITSTEWGQNYVVRLQGWDASCSSGRKVTIKISVFRGATLMSSSQRTSACVPNFLGTASATQDAIANLILANCSN